MTLVIGIDGGGTHTRAVLVDERLTVIARAQGPGSNPVVIGWARTAAVLQALVDDLLAGAGIAPGEPAALGAGLAGAPEMRNRPELEAMFARILPGALLVPSWDAEVALVGAHGRREGILLFSGTGSGAFGVNPQGQAARAGAWGYLIGDEGSGYAIGSGGLRAVMQAYDGRRPETMLTARILAALQFDSPEDIITWVYGQTAESRSGKIGALAPVVAEAARAGDAVAAAIVAQAVDDLVLTVQAVARALAMPSGSLALTGSLITAPESYVAELLRAALAARLEAFTLIKTQHPPEIGAAILAFDALAQQEGNA